MEKTAFITGAGGYIGTQTAITLAREGINIAVCDISEKSVRSTAARPANPGCATSAARTVRAAAKRG